MHRGLPITKKPPTRACFSAARRSSSGNLLPEQFVELIARHDSLEIELVAGGGQLSRSDFLVIGINPVQEPRLRVDVVEADGLRVRLHRESQVEQDLAQDAERRLKHLSP